MAWISRGKYNLVRRVEEETKMYSGSLKTQTLGFRPRLRLCGILESNDIILEEQNL